MALLVVQLDSPAEILWLSLATDECACCCCCWPKADELELLVLMAPLVAFELWLAVMRDAWR